MIHLFKNKHRAKVYISLILSDLYMVFNLSIFVNLMSVMKHSPKFAVIGGGSWATAIVKMLSENLTTISWYMRNSRAVEYIKNNKHNPKYLSSVEFNLDQLQLTDDINTAVENADILIFAIPSAFLKDELEKT